jgi:hypothetical protein
MAVVICVVGAVTAQATYIYDLYGGTTTSAAAAGTGGNGYARAEQFNPTTAFNPVPAGEFITAVSMYAMQQNAGEAGSVQLKVYQWNTNPATTVAGAVLGQSAVIPLIAGSGPTQIRAVLTTQQPTSGMYFAALWLSGISGPLGIDINGLKTNTGGASNDAWNSNSSGWGTARTDREYSVVLEVTPEPMTIAMLGLGGLILVRRRR